VSQALFVVADDRVCAVHLRDVRECMRRLPIDALDGMPPFVLGVAVIRGAPVPVIDLGRLLAPEHGGGPRARLVTLAVGERSAAIAVDAVRGIGALDDDGLVALPSLLGAVGSPAIAQLGTIDAALLIVLSSARLVPESVWTAMDRREARP
jgi:purine-binding chemotaxis protein CheW